MKNPYPIVIKRVNDILSHLLDLMTKENDLKIFKNMVAIYVMWQHDLDCLERESLTWNERNSK